MTRSLLDIVSPPHPQSSNWTHKALKPNIRAGLRKVGTRFADKCWASDEIEGAGSDSTAPPPRIQRNAGENGDTLPRMGPAYVPMPASSTYFTLLNYIRPFQI
jgi:hypothetical protein